MDLYENKLYSIDIVWKVSLEENFSTDLQYVNVIVIKIPAPSASCILFLA